MRVAGGGSELELLTFCCELGAEGVGARGCVGSNGGASGGDGAGGAFFGGG